MVNVFDPRTILVDDNEVMPDIDLFESNTRAFDADAVPAVIPVINPDAVIDEDTSTPLTIRVEALSELIPDIFLFISRINALFAAADPATDTSMYEAYVPFNVVPPNINVDALSELIPDISLDPLSINALFGAAVPAVIADT